MPDWKIKTRIGNFYQTSATRTLNGDVIVFCRFLAFQAIETNFVENHVCFPSIS